jgi:hypothetical protein
MAWVCILMGGFMAGWGFSGRKTASDYVMGILGVILWAVGMSNVGH